MKRAEKRHLQMLKEYSKKIEFVDAEEEIIRHFYTQQELEDILTSYDLEYMQLHLKKL